MRAIAAAVIAGLAVCAGPLAAQEADAGAGEIIVTGSLRKIGPDIRIVVPPVIGLRRLADSAVRSVEIVSDSREAAMRKREVQAMLLDAIDRAKRDGFALVTGQFEVTEITRANWQEQLPGLAGKADPSEDTDDDDDDDENDKPAPVFEDDGSIAYVRVKVKTRLDGSIGNAQQKISGFVTSVPVTGRAQIKQKGSLALTIINPEQYRDELYRRIAAGAKQAVGFYGPDYGLEVTGLDGPIAWKQVGRTELFLYIGYGFTVGK